MTCGRWSGSAFCPLRSVGARKNWKHSVYVAGVPLPWSMFRQPIHLAPGATPIWFAPPSSPTVGPGGVRAVAVVVAGRPGVRAADAAAAMDASCQL